MELAHRLAGLLREHGDDPENARRLGEASALLATELASWAGRMNLTGPRTPDLIADRLLLPPLIWSRLLPVAPHSIADIGSGAGIPGFPLALRFPEADVVLIEARQKRHHFQRHAIRKLSSLGLGRVRTLLGRSEELRVEPAALAVAQALAPLPAAVFHVKQWTEIGGILAIPQGECAGDLGDPDLRWISCREYSEPFRNQPRFLWMSERIA